MTVLLIEGEKLHDERGWFMEVYSDDRLAALGITCRFRQDNHSCSKRAYTLRGLHFQAPPYAQDKLVRCIRGAVFDVAVDIRRGSPTFGAWTGTRLSAASGDQLFIPVGYAHGFLTLEPDSEVGYKCSERYAPGHEGGVRWDDPTIAIDWPLPPAVAPELSARDRQQPLLADLASPFTIEPQPAAPAA